MKFFWVHIHVKLWNERERKTSQTAKISEKILLINRTFNCGGLKEESCDLVILYQGSDKLGKKKVNKNLDSLYC